MARFKSRGEFIEAYRSRGVIDKVSRVMRPPNPLNDRQLDRCYESYVRKWTRADAKPRRGKSEAADAELSRLARERDGGCRLLAALTEDERAEWARHEGGLGWTLDAAHVFGKGAYPWMRLDPDNVVLLNRFSHRCLDTGLSPISARPISMDERRAWWRRIVGEERWARLTEKSLARK